MEYYAVVYVQCTAADKLKRIKLYLDGETRPDFSEEVPDNESCLVEAFECVPVPESIRDIESKGVVAHIYPDSPEEAENLVKALALFEPDNLYMFFSDDEEAQIYYRFKDDKVEFLYSETPFDDPDQDEKYNRNLLPELAKSIENIEDKGEALEFLANSMAS